MTIKSIIVLLCLTFLLSSCFSTKEEIIKEDKKIVNNNEKIVEQINWLQKIPKDDIRNKTKYSENFLGLQEMFFNKNKDVIFLLSYLDNLEYQGIIENKEKEYANIIINIGKEYIKNNIENEKIEIYSRKKSLDRLFNKIGDNYKKLGDTENTIKFYKKAINENPNSYKTFIKLGNLYNELGNEKEYKIYKDNAKKIIKENKVIEKINNSFKMFKYNYGGYINLGIIYKLLGNIEESNINFNKAKKIINSKNISINKYELGKLNTYLNNKLKTK